MFQELVQACTARHASIETIYPDKILITASILLFC